MCGIFGVIGHKEASRLTYLGLYALQHRGEESVGVENIRQKFLKSFQNSCLKKRGKNEKNRL